MKKIMYCLLIISGIFNNVQAQDCNDAIHTGEGTFYGGIAGTSGGNCSLPVDAGDIFHCALNSIDYDNSNGCGACIKVTGPKGSVILKVVDRCPECAAGDVDLTQGAFEQIADVIDGRVAIEWEFVPCSEIEDPGNIKINFKSGSSQYWTAIQFRDIEHAIVAMEYKDTNGAWISVNRELFNFFIEPAGIPTPMDLRITSVLGETLIFENVPIDTNNDYDTGMQLTTPATCSGGVIVDTSCPEYMREELVGKTVRIQNKDSGLFSQISGNADTSIVRLANPNNTGTWTQWVVEESEVGGIYYYGFRNVSSGKRLRGNSTGGIELGATNSTGSWTQWLVTTDNGTDYKLFNRGWEEFYSAGGNTNTASLVLADATSGYQESQVTWNFLNVNDGETTLECVEATANKNGTTVTKNIDATFKMYPNPSSSFVTFTNPSYVTKDNETLTVVCTNTLGQTINFKTAMHNGIMQVDVSEIPSGMYLIKVSNTTEVLYVDKLMIK